MNFNFSRQFLIGCNAEFLVYGAIIKASRNRDLPILPKGRVGNILKNSFCPMVETLLSDDELFKHKKIWFEEKLKNFLEKQPDVSKTEYSSKDFNLMVNYLVAKYSPFGMTKELLINDLALESSKLNRILLSLNKGGLISSVTIDRVKHYFVSQDLEIKYHQYQILINDMIRFFESYLD